MVHHQQQQASLPSLPSLLGSLSGGRQYVVHPQQQIQYQQQHQLQQYQQHYQHQSAPLPRHHPTQLQPQTPVSISSLLNPSTADARAAAPFRSLPSLTAAAPLVRVRPRPAASVPAAASPKSSNGSESGLDEASSQQTQQLQPPKKKRKARICKTDGCEKYVVDRGLCIRHGVSWSYYSFTMLWLLP